MECEECEDGYYFNTVLNLCLKGHVLNCLTFPNDDPNTCEECNENFVHIDKVLLSGRNYNEPEIQIIYDLDRTPPIEPLDYLLN